MASGQQIDATGAAQKEEECYGAVLLHACGTGKTAPWPALIHLRSDNISLLSMLTVLMRNKVEQMPDCLCSALRRPQAAPHRHQPEDAGSVLLTAAI